MSRAVRRRFIRQILKRNKQLVLRVKLLAALCDAIYNILYTPNGPDRKKKYVYPIGMYGNGSHGHIG